MNDDSNPTSQTELPNEQPPASPLWHYALILAEVIFESKRSGIGSRRLQFFSKSETSLFPVPRLERLQRVAAMKATITFPKEQKITTHEILILNISPLGMMTDDEFYGTANDFQGTTTAPPVTDLDNVDMTNVSVIKPA